MSMESVRAVVQASRPSGWCFGSILFAIGWLHSARTGPRTAVGLQLLSLSFPLALVVFGINDVYDYPTDVRNPRKNADGLEGAVLDPAYHAPVVLAAVLATVSIVAVSLLVGRIHNVAVVAALLALSWQYSAPPLRFKERPLLDSLSNGAIVDLAYLAGFTAGGGLLGRRMLRLKGHVLGLCTAGVHALGAAVDVDADAAVGQRTIATVFGARFAVGLGVLSYTLAFLIERELTIFGVYILGGVLIMLSPFLELDLAHLAFQVIVYWTGAMSAVWFADKARSAFYRSTTKDK